MARGYWAIRTYRAGMVGEKIKYWVPGEKPTRSQRKLRSDIKQQQRNEANAERRLARLLNEYFSPGDLLVRLSYSDAGLERTLAGIDREAEGAEDAAYQATQHQARLWRDRAARACKAAGVPLRYVIVTSDMDGKTGEAVRLHHHVVINREAVEIALGKWSLGETNRKRLYDQVDYTGLAEYLLEQVRRMPDEKKYIPSRNMPMPQPKDRIARNGAELAVPKGGQLLHRSEYQPGRPQYIRYILPEVGKLRREREQKRE